MLDIERKTWEVQGMTCASCALSITKILQKNGATNVQINVANKKAIFDIHRDTDLKIVAHQINNLGYHVSLENDQSAKAQSHQHAEHYHNGLLLLICSIFTLPLLFGHYIYSFDFLMNEYVNLGFAIPVYLIGCFTLGKTAIRSLFNGTPNMNTLIMLGATAAFAYSLTGTILHLPGYMFYETTASIITIVLIGNYIEERTVASTQKAIHDLIKEQKIVAHMITFNDQHQEVILEVESDNLNVGDLILIRDGDKVPVDCKILVGEAKVNEALITGESLPVEKTNKDTLIGGSIIEHGNVKAQVTAVGNDTVLASIIKMMEDAQNEKPTLQNLADRISAVFIPFVLIVSIGTFVINFFILNEVAASLLRSIAVLVIACPCAMGLATPAAIAVGLGRATRKGILFRNAKGLEHFKQIKRIVFDKTGTLTTGKFAVTRYLTLNMDDHLFKSIVIGLETYSSHPLARSIIQSWQDIPIFSFQKVEEIKSLGIQGTDEQGNLYQIGSFRLLENQQLEIKEEHALYVLKNQQLIGWIDVEDTIRDDAKELINQLHNKGIETVLLSGDRATVCQKVAQQVGITKVFSECLPKDKENIVATLNQEKPTAMVGDGINDAPALAKATIGISVSKASQIAVQAAQIVLVNNRLHSIYESIVLGQYTHRTIIRNFIWAFSYNIIAIPIAASGLLTPTFGAIVMGMSDVILLVSSSYLAIQKIK